MLSTAGPKLLRPPVMEPGAAEGIAARMDWKVLVRMHARTSLAFEVEEPQLRVAVTLNQAALASDWETVPKPLMVPDSSMRPLTIGSVA
jgi:hypothetical protein